MIWREARVSEVYKALYDGPHATPTICDEGPIFLSISNVSESGQIDLTKTKHILESEYQNWTKRVVPEKGDIVFTYEASLHRYGIIPAGFVGCLGRRLALVRPDNEKAYYKYLFYYFLSDAWRKEVGNYILTGTTVDRVPLTKFPHFKLRLPDLLTQKKIAAILSAYDDLIENNKRRIALLEKMAEEIYREWFVRFRFPGYQNAEFEKGIPKGWHSKTFRELVSYYIGGGWGGEEGSPTLSKGAYVIRGTDIPALAKGDYSSKVYRYHKPSNFKSRKMLANDFIFEVSGGSKDQLLGRNLMITEGLLELFDNEVICASFCKQIRFNEDIVSPFFMKYFLKMYYECDLVGIYQVQSTGISNYQFESFLNYQTVQIPDQKLLDQFDAQIKPIVDQQEKLAYGNMALAKTKNLLLPRLISGKLSVEELAIQFPPSMQDDAA